MEGFKFEAETKEQEKPWGKLIIEDEKRFIDKYENEEQKETDQNTKKEVEASLIREIHDRRSEFTNKWFLEHSNEIKERGYNANAKNKEEIIKTVQEMGGFEEWQKNEETENLYALRSGLEKPRTPLEIWFLALNVLSKRTNRLELDIALKKGDKTGRREKKKELNELWGIQKTIVEKISGENLDIPHGLWRGKKAEKLLKEKIEFYAGSPEKAEGGIEAVYERVKNKLVTEFITNDLRKDEKSKEELTTIEKAFNQQGIKINDFLEPVIHRRKGLENLTGNWPEDENRIKKFLEGFGVPVGNLKTENKEMNQIIQSYNSAMKKRKGFLKWFVELIFSLQEFNKK